MEGEPGYLSGVRGGVCSREEKKKKRRKTEDRNSGVSSASSGFHDDRSSAASGLDVADRLTYLEQRMQMQEDEIQLLKMALADVLKRLSISEEQQAAGRRAAGLRARPVSLALPPRPPMVTSPLKKCPTMPSCSTPRSFSPTPSRSGVKSPPGSVKDSPCKSTARPAAKKTPDAKSKEPASVGTRRVTHCKVTMQIYLSPLARKTGSSEAAASAAAARADRGPAATPVKTPRPNESRKATPSFTLNLQKSSQSSTQDISSYKSPTKSPSQYFQICY
uniref:EMAP like 1 n=1 Tax=Oryzias melastigma TaxID=30732 RepID=A0A3B3DVF0_ORYME